MCAYQSNKPEATDKKYKSQADIAENFTQLKTVIDINHETFAAANQGKHKQVAFPVQGASVSTAANEVALYCKDNAAGAASLLFRFEGDGTEVDFTTSAQSANGWTRLPSGILLKWGTSAADGSTSINFPTGATIPVFSAIYQVMISTEGNGGLGNHDFMAYLTAKTTTTMTVYGSARTVNATRSGNFDYLAIGI